MSEEKRAAVNEALWSAWRLGQLHLKADDANRFAEKTRILELFNGTESELLAKLELKEVVNSSSTTEPGN